MQRRNPLRRELTTRGRGANFDLREYREVVLNAGAVPLDGLEDNVRGWILRKTG